MTHGHLAGCLQTTVGLRLLRRAQNESTDHNNNKRRGQTCTAWVSFISSRAEASRLTSRSSGSLWSLRSRLSFRTYSSGRTGNSGGTSRPWRSLIEHTTTMQSGPK